MLFLPILLTSAYAAVCTCRAHWWTIGLLLLLVENWWTIGYIGKQFVENRLHWWTIGYIGEQLVDNEFPHLTIWCNFG